MDQPRNGPFRSTRNFSPPLEPHPPPPPNNVATLNAATTAPIKNGNNGINIVSGHPPHEFGRTPPRSKASNISSTSPTSVTDMSQNATAASTVNSSSLVVPSGVSTDYDPHLGKHNNNDTHTSVMPSEEDEEEAGGVIAIGIPDAPHSAPCPTSPIHSSPKHFKRTAHPSNEPPLSTPTEQGEANTLAVSEAVAQGLAEQEHECKQKQVGSNVPVGSFQSSVAHAAAVVPRTPPAASKPTKGGAIQSAAAAFAQRRRTSLEVQSDKETNESDDHDHHDAKEDKGTLCNGVTGEDNSWDKKHRAKEVGNLKAPPPPLAITAAPAVSPAPTPPLVTSLPVRQKSGETATAEDLVASAAPNSVRAVARSSRYMVRGSAAQAHNRRSMAKQNQKDDTGPSLAAPTAGTETLLHQTEWMDLDTDLVPPPSAAAAHATTTAVGAFAWKSEDCKAQAKVAAEEETGPTLAPASAVPSLAVPTTARVSLLQHTVGPSQGETGLHNSNNSLEFITAAPPPTSHPHRPSVSQALNHNQDDPGRDVQHDTDWTAFVSATPALALESAQAHIVADDNNTDNPQNNEDVLEADAGIAVRPGAFAIQGMDARDNDDSQDSLHYDSGDDLEGASGEQDVETSGIFRDPTSEFLVDEGGDEDDDGMAVVVPPDGAALQAELYERELFEGNIVVEDEDEYEADPKMMRRLRMVQLMVVCFSLIGIICVVISAITGFGESGGTSLPPKPIISGWELVANPAFGPRKEEDLVLMGSVVAISQDGARIVTTAPGASKDGVRNVGEVYVLEQMPTLDENGTEISTWEVLHTLPGLGGSENPTASMSSDGLAEVVAVGYPLLQDDGHVQIFEASMGWESPVILSASNGTQSSVVAATSTSDDVPLTGFGYSVGLSQDGTMLAVGAPLYEVEPNSVTGFVRVYQQEQLAETNGPTTTTWKRMGGKDLQGVHPNELFGWSVSLRRNRVAVGGPAFDIDRGLVRVYEWDAIISAWEQVGSDIVGKDPLNRFGESVALSEDGTVLAVGARGTAFDPGQVKVFRQRKETGEWLADDHSFVGQDAGDGLGAAVTLSDNGNTLAIGAPENGEFGTSSGHIQVWQYESFVHDTTMHAWVQQGSNIGGTEGSNMGSSVALVSTEDMLRVVGGAPGADYDGSVAKAGSFLVYNQQKENEET